MRILVELAALRASEPEVPMASRLDLEEVNVPEQSVPECCAGVEQGPCTRRECVWARESVAELNVQVDTLLASLREVSRRFRTLQRRLKKRPSDVRKVTKKLLTSLVFGEDEEEEDVVPPSPEQGIPTDQRKCCQQSVQD